MLRTYRTPKGTELPISVIKGKEYLEVKYRLVWFCEERPLWRVETEFLLHTNEQAVARAVIRDEHGTIIRTAHKQECKKDFPDFMEKAETGAIGRALALIGYGTQFTDDLDEGVRIVDAPVKTVHQIRPNGSGGNQIVSHVVPMDPMGMEDPEPLFQEPPWDAEPDPMIDDPANFKITFGKYKDYSLAEAIKKDGLPKIQDYIGWLEDNAVKKGQTLSDSARFFSVAVGRYIQNKQGGK